MVDHVISQPKIRELFKGIKTNVGSLVNLLLQLIQRSKDLAAQEVFTRFISHLCFCVAPISDDVLLKLLQQLGRPLANHAKDNQNLQKASLNCLSNLLHNEQYVLPPPVLQLLPDVYRKLKDMLLNLTKTKNPMSKKFVILLTTALRSF